MKLVRGALMLAPLALAALSSEAAVRILTPGEPLPAPEPVDIRDHFSAEEIARGRRYARPQMAIGLTRSALDAAVLAWVVSRQARRGRLAQSGVGSAALAGAALTSAMSLPGLPLSALARHRALRVGLATQSWREWGIDLVKANAIQGGLAAAGAAAVTIAARRWPRGWWLPAAVGSVGFGAVFAALAPVVLDPVFNDFTPLPEGETRQDVLSLAADAGVSVGEVFSVDASRRTTAANAYVTGLGPTKRVVLFDTLLERFNRDEVRVVVAHELAHVRHRDVIRSVAFAALTAPAATFAIQRLSWAMSPARYRRRWRSSPAVCRGRWSGAPTPSRCGCRGLRGRSSRSSGRSRCRTSPTWNRRGCRPGCSPVTRRPASGSAPRSPTSGRSQSFSPRSLSPRSRCRSRRTRAGS